MDAFPVTSLQVDLFIIFLRGYILTAEKNVFIVFLVKSFISPKGLHQESPPTLVRTNQQDLRVDAFYTSRTIQQSSPKTTAFSP